MKFPTKIKCYETERCAVTLTPFSLGELGAHLGALDTLRRLSELPPDTQDEIAREAVGWYIRSTSPISLSFLRAGTPGAPLGTYYEHRPGFPPQIHRLDPDTLARIIEERGLLPGSDTVEDESRTDLGISEEGFYTYEEKAISRKRSFAFRDKQDLKEGKAYRIMSARNILGRSSMVPIAMHSAFNIKYNGPKGTKITLCVPYELLAEISDVVEDWEFTAMGSGMKARYYKTAKGRENNEAKRKALKTAQCVYYKLSTIHRNGIISSPSFVGTKGLKHTFGIEIETSSGILPYEVATAKGGKYAPVASVFDGSLRVEEGVDPKGAEYVTVPMQGDTGLKMLQNLCYELTRRCNIDHRCSVHVHIGVNDSSRTVCTAMLAICAMLESELYMYMPKSRSKNVYCRPLPEFVHEMRSLIDFKSKESLENSINIVYSQLFYELADKAATVSSFKGKDKKYHPKGDKCGYNHDNMRYCWVNFVPLLFDREAYSAKTLEYRIHSASTNYSKIRNWLLVCMAITAMAENDPHRVLKIWSERGTLTLQEVLENSFTKDYSKHLMEFYIERYKKFKGSECEDSVEEERFISSYIDLLAT